MKGKSLWKYAPSIGPIFSIALIGLLLLSALLYYRSVKIQRFLEPALAMSQPKNEFSKHIKLMFSKEFGEGPINGLELKASSIFVAKTLFFFEDGTIKSSAQDDIQKLARIFLSLLDDNHTKSDISIVLVNSRFHSAGPQMDNYLERMKAQHMAWQLQDALFHSEPELGKKHDKYFTVSAQPVSGDERGAEVLELRIIPSELLHVEALQKLFKYAH